MLAKIDRKNITNGPAGRGLNLSFKDLTPGHLQTLAAALHERNSGQGNELLEMLKAIWPDDIRKPYINI